MAGKAEYDFLNWKSFPSSLKLQSDLPDWWFSGSIAQLTVAPGKQLTSKVFTKQENVTAARPSGIAIHGYDGKTWKYIAADIVIPVRTISEWMPFERTQIIPPEIMAIKINPWIGASLGPQAPAAVWYDDLKIYQDGVLIYSNDFAKWDPYIGAGLGAGVLGVVVPAVVRVPEPSIAYEYQKPYLEKEPLLAAGLAGLGALVGGGIGLLTAMGLVPQIPTPTLEAPTEEPEAPTQLGKYQITG